MLLTRLFRNFNITPVRNKSVSLWRNYRRKEALAQWEGGIEYKGFTYHPRPGEVDPPYEPSKLFMVQRTGKWKGTEYWYKCLLFNFKLDPAFKKSKVVIIKNTPDNNAKLWKIKHLVKITPITFPDGVPEEGDVFSTCLNHKGELRINKKLDTVDPELLLKEQDRKKLTGEDLRRQSLRIWTQPWKSPFDN